MTAPFDPPPSRRFGALSRWPSTVSERILADDEQPSKGGTAPTPEATGPTMSGPA
jgi:hypothetical protein